jgi:hypothetical protein
MQFDLLIALRLHHDLSEVAAPTPHSGACETWVPLDPHRPGSAVHDKWVRPTRRLVNLSVGPTDLVRGPHDLLKTFQKILPDDMIQHDLKTWRTRQDLGGFRLKQIDGIWQDV